MLQIDEIRGEHRHANRDETVITDNRHPRFSFSLKSDRRECSLRSALIRVNGWEAEAEDQRCVVYRGEALKPFTKYPIEITAADDLGETAHAAAVFQTGRMGLPWKGIWISDPDSHTESPASPPPAPASLLSVSVGLTAPGPSWKSSRTGLSLP